MGLIRSGNTELTPVSDDAELTEYLWPIVREMINTAIENSQNLIVEGCYIPFDWKKDFSADHLENIRFFCLVMSENYIWAHFNDIKRYAGVIEKRMNDDCTLESVIEDNAHKRYTDDEIVLQGCGGDEYIYRRLDRRDERFTLCEEKSYG